MEENKYFSVPALSKSQVRAYDPSNPIAFWRKCAFNPQKETNDDTDYIAQGHLSHMMLFQRELVKDNFVVIDGLGKSRKTIAWSKAQESETKTIISSFELEEVTKRTEALFKHELILNLLKCGKAEAPFFWHDPIWDIDCKMRTDYETGSDEGIYCIDLKTTAKEFPKYIDKGNYQYEVGFYTRGLNYKYLKFNQAVKKFIYVFQSTKKGEEHKIEVKVVEGAMLEACVIDTDLIVRQIVPKIKEYLAKPEEKIWLPDIKPEPFEISPWYDREMANKLNKGE